MGPTFNRRTAGTGIVCRGSRKNSPWDAYAPGSRHVRGELLGKFDNSLQANRALNAWYVVRALVALIGVLAGCGAAPPVAPYRPAYVDPALGEAPSEALAAWNEATGGRYPKLRLSFRIASTIDSAAKIVESDHKEADYVIAVSPWVPVEWHRRALLHELGHAVWVMPEPESGDPYHYHGPAPSVMRPELNDCADEIGQPELAAFERKFGGQ